MTVFDVTQIVKPGAPASTAPGRYLVAHFDREEMARTHAQRCAACCNIPQWISYRVEPHEERCPGRAWSYADRRAPVDVCTCTL